MTHHDDLALFGALARGDLGALDVLYDRHAPILYAVALHLAGDRIAADDLLHDVFVDLTRFARREDFCPSVLRWLLVRLVERTR